jgi:hypothetical protein
MATLLNSRRVQQVVRVRTELLGSTASGSGPGLAPAASSAVVPVPLSPTPLYIWLPVYWSRRPLNHALVA